MDFEKRLRRLEATNRILIALLVVAVACFAVVQVDAANRAQNIVADNITAHSIAIVDEHGVKKVMIEDSNIGSGISIADEAGKFALGLHVLPTGQPSVCFSDGKICRLVIGSVLHLDKSDMSVDLRDKSGQSIWMPPVSNPYAVSVRQQK